MMYYLYTYQMTVNVGLIGVGYWGPNLLRNLYNLPDCNLISVCDLSSERCDFVQSNYPHSICYK